jgi:hypothetical protein
VRLNDAVQQFIDSGDWLGLLGYYAKAFGFPAPLLDISAHPRVAAGVLLLLALLLAWRLLRRQPWRRPRIPWKLGPMTVDLKGGQQTLHTIVAGTTRSGKSSAVLPLLTLPGPFVGVGFDVSKPLEDWWAAHANNPTYIHWRMDGSLGWNILEGPALSVSEGLTAGFARSAGDRGIYRGHVSTRLLRLIRQDDEAGCPRDLRRYIGLLRQPTGDREADTACKDWASRFDGLLERFGPAFGNDFSLASAVRQHKKVLVLPNRFLHPESAMLIGGIGLVQSRRAAGEIGGFIQFIEEAGQASYYTEEINASFQAGGTRECPTILATQNLSSLKNEIANNARVWLVFNQQIAAEAKIGAERLRLDDPSLLLDLPTGDAYVRSPDAGPQLVHIKLPKLPKAKPKRTYANEPANLKTETPAARRFIVTELPREDEETVPVLPPPRLEVQALLEQIDRSGHCHVWTGTQDRDGYGIFRWEGNWKRVHRIVWELTCGPIPVDEKGAALDLDHLCRNRLCSKIDHLEPVTRGENVRRMWAYRGKKGRAAI